MNPKEVIRLIGSGVSGYRERRKQSLKDSAVRELVADGKRIIRIYARVAGESLPAEAAKKAFGEGLVEKFRAMPQFGKLNQTERVDVLTAALRQTIFQ